MKAGFLAVAAAMVLGVSASSHNHHAHEAFHKAVERGMPKNSTAASNDVCTCGQYTVWVTTYGEATLHQPAPPATSAPVSNAPTSPATTGPASVPTPMVTVCPTTGVYTFPATTITLTESTTVCAAATTSVPSGTHTYGGVTTVVTTSTTIVCPYATVTTKSGVTTSTILTTTTVCPSAGTYTVAPTTTTIVESTVLVYPTPATYPPGTYCQPEITTTIHETSVVVVCPFTSSVAAPTSASVVPTSAVAVPTSSSAPVQSSTPQNSSPSLGGSNGKQWAITYTPYTSTGQCKSASEVMVDMATIKSKGFSTVRLYATDCSGLVNVGAGCEAAGLKMIVGIFINNQGISGAAPQVKEIVAWGKWHLVELIVVGNECVFNGFAGAAELVQFIKTCKATFAGAGYSGPITTTEPLNILQQYTSLFCEVVDIVGCNIHPFFNSAVDASSAGQFVADQLSIVNSLCPNKSGINLETGWPSGGDCNGKACPGLDHQKTAIEGILSTVGGSSVIFSFINDEWKDLGAFNCERNFGAIHLFD